MHIMLVHVMDTTFLLLVVSYVAPVHGTAPRPAIALHSTMHSGKLLLPYSSILWRSLQPCLCSCCVQHLLWPPLQHTHVEQRKDVVINLVHMHDTLGPPMDHIRVPDLSAAFRALGDVSSVQIHESWISFADCDLCVAAFTASLKVGFGAEGKCPQPL